MSLNRFAVKSATFSFGSTSLDMASAPVIAGETREACEVTSLADQVRRFIKGALKEKNEFTASFYDKGTGMPTVDSAPANVSISVTLENGEDTDVTETYTEKCLVTKVSPPSQDATGDRKATVDITFRPTGEASSSSQG